MEKLSKQELKNRDEVIAAVREAHLDLQRVWFEYEAMIDRINGYIERLNGAIADADTFRQSIADQLQEYFDDKSENWQDSDKGGAYQDWIQQWEIGVEQVDELECEQCPDLFGLEDLEQAASELEF